MCSLASEALQRVAPRSDGYTARMSRDELVALVTRIMNADGSEEVIGTMIAQLEASVPHPRITDLIFHANDPNVSAAGIVDEALSYQPLLTPPPSRRG